MIRDKETKKGWLMITEKGAPDKRRIGSSSCDRRRNIHNDFLLDLVNVCVLSNIKASLLS